MSVGLALGHEVFIDELSLIQQPPVGIGGDQHSRKILEDGQLGQGDVVREVDEMVGQGLGHPGPGDTIAGMAGSCRNWMMPAAGGCAGSRPGPAP